MTAPQARLRPAMASGMTLPTRLTLFVLAAAAWTGGLALLFQR